MNPIIGAAKQIARIPNPEVRDTLAYALDEVHGWRCGLLGGMDECEAVAYAYTESDPPTKAVKVLQPITSAFAWYIKHPITNRIGKLQVWDDDDLDAPVKWRPTREFFFENPLKMWPGIRDEFNWVVKVAAKRTWYSADEFIAQYVAEVATRMVNDHYGVPYYFSQHEEEIGWDMADACYTFSLEQLAELSRIYFGIDGDADDDRKELWPAALAEAIEIGMLWD